MEVGGAPDVWVVCLRPELDIVAVTWGTPQQGLVGISNKDSVAILLAMCVLPCSLPS